MNYDSWEDFPEIFEKMLKLQILGLSSSQMLFSPAFFLFQK